MQTDVSRGVRRCNAVFRLKTSHIHVNVFDTVQQMAGFLTSNGGKLDEAEDFKCVFVVYCVFESK